MGGAKPYLRLVKSVMLSHKVDILTMRRRRKSHKAISRTSESDANLIVYFKYNTVLFSKCFIF